MFTINITEPAKADIEQAYAWWAEHRSADQAKRWYKEIQLAIATLKRMPLRCPAVPETKLSVAGVKELLFGVGKHPTHRIIFTIDSDIVVILRVRHRGQDVLEPGDVTG